VAYSRSESKQAAMRAEFPDPRIRWAIGDVRSRDRLTEACRGVDFVVHAAALKRIEVCLENTREAYDTNYGGTRNVADACIATGVTRAVLLSSDKAAAASTRYGRSKAAAEDIWIDSNRIAASTPSRFSCCRYGNVLGSTGSVIPMWRAQAAAGEAIKITEPSMSRFWMPISAAVDLVVLTLATMRGGEVVIPRLQGATVGDLAVAVAPGCTWETIGNRGGEKMHETLIAADEAPHTYDAGDRYIIEPALRTWGELPPLPFPRVPLDFEYRSDLGIPLEPHDISALVAA
jgi:UDP-N-acetylglucosamine 4,6-dehydratase